MAAEVNPLEIPIILKKVGTGDKDAIKAMGSMESAASALSKKLAGAFSVYKIAQFAKASAKAYMDDQRAAALLANQLKNLGLGSVTGEAADFIATMEKQTGILDDQLRPAFSQLARVTGSVTETQKIMKTAFDASRGSGEDFQSVVDALSQAYVGNYKGLKQLNLGLTNTELSGKTFAQVMELINSQFAGAGAASMETYAGQMDALNVAAANASETIGKSLLDSLKVITGSTGIQDLTDKIDGAAQSIGRFIDIMGRGVRGLYIFGEAIRGRFSDAKKDWKQLMDDVGKQDAAWAQRNMKVWYPAGYQTAAEKAAAAAAKKRAAAIAAEVKKQAAAQAELNKKKADQVKLDQASLALKQAEGIFNMDQIEIAAALLNKQSNEDLARLKLKKDLIDLQDAINNKDVEAAQVLAKKVQDDYAVVAAYQQQNVLAAVQANLLGGVAAAAQKIPENKSIIDIKNLNDALALINELLAKLGMVKMPNLTLPGGSSNGNGAGTGGLPPITNPGGGLTDRGSHNLPPLEDSAMETFVANLAEANKVIADNAAALKPITDTGLFDLAFNAAESAGGWLNPFQMSAGAGAAYSQSQVVVNVAGSVTAEKDLVDAIVAGLNEVSASGVKPFVNRLNPEYL